MNCEPNADQQVVKQKNSLENNLAICVKNIKHTHNFYIKLRAQGSLVRNYSRLKGGMGVGCPHS